MPDPNKPKPAARPATKPAKAGARSGAHTAVSRRAEVRKALPKRDSVWRRLWHGPDALAILPIVLLFVLLAAAVTVWTREQPIAAIDRVATRTWLVRSEFRVLDAAAVESARRTARQNTPRVYTIIEPVFNEIEAALSRLPTALADAQTLDAVAPEIRDAFELTEPELAALRTHAVAGDASQAWRSRVAALVAALAALPILDNETYQLEQTSGSRQWIELRRPDADPARLLKGRAVNLASAQLATSLRQAALGAGFEEPLASMIARWRAKQGAATHQFDHAAATAAQDAAAAAVEPVYITYPAGRALVTRGERIDASDRALLIAERDAFIAHSPAAALWAPRIAAAIAVALVTIGLALSISAFCRRIRRNPLRIITVAAMLLGALALAAAIAVSAPAFTPVAVAVPTAFIAAILVIAYDRATALSLGALHAILVLVALDQPAAWIVPAFAGVYAVAWTLDEVRHRRDLVRSGLITGVAMALATAAVITFTRPAADGLWREILIDTAWTFGAGIAIGVVTLAILPTIERVFDIITGMTLIELRDPKQPLLRELQRRAPGTYNHSIAVANIAETAAEAVGADSLHLYVGALYHDIGKMNKPDYFVENQTGGLNRHNRLSPAMSLLVIVGHVKDGVELAREYNLPRSLHHYIDSHHGSTLVEYFFHQAQKHSDEHDSPAPDEIDYRYPGPRPRTREAAILMLSDAVESATRALKEPAPARIESLVRQLARKRLEDGQFDDCDLTLRELHTIESSIIKSLISIYHARLAYPDADSRHAAPAPDTAETIDTKSSQFERTMSQSA